MGEKKATIRDVAKDAGVSVATISRFINKKGYVSQSTEKKIRKVMKELDYSPNEIARGLAKKKTNTIALFIPDITNPFFPELIKAVERIANDKGYRIILVSSNADDSTDTYNWENHVNMYIDGFIFSSYQLNELSIEDLKAKHIPFVIIDRAANLESEYSIGIDNYKGAVLAVEHLISIGCKKIAHISGPKQLQISKDRQKGYSDTMKTHFPGDSVISYEGDFSLESGKKMAQALIEEHPDTDGIFLANDLMAIGCQKAMRLMGKNIPEEIAIIGFDGIQLTKMVEPEISTIEQPIYEIGVSAVTKLLQIIEEEQVDSHQSLDIRLVERESTLGFRKK